MDSSSGFNVLDRKTSLNSDFLCWMKSSGSGSKISMMDAHQQQTNPFSLGDDDGGGGRAAGPTNKSGGPNEAAAGSIYSDQVSSCDAGVGFDYCKSPAAAGGGFPFTAAQWKELERQAMIYKCMISSVPVPPHLLFPLDSSFPCGLYGGRYSRKGDPEPGRCKRTDGKKWRCSREVAPQQKYCERHLHRGRPRSRKPVEANNKKTRLQQPPAPPNQLIKPKTNMNISTPYYKQQPLEDLMGGFDPPPLNLFSYPEMDLPIDAWSIDNLDLSMGVAVGKRNTCDADFDPTKWCCAPGGPLGEALQPGSVAVAGSNPASPSGVLHRTLFSHSDGSVCNSPTLEISNNWHV